MKRYEGTHGTWFRHPDNFQGELEVKLPNGDYFKIPCDDILELVAYQYVRPQKTNFFEQMGFEELLTY